MGRAIDMEKDIDTLKLEVEKGSNAYRKRLPKRSRKTFCQ